MRSHKRFCTESSLRQLLCCIRGFLDKKLDPLKCKAAIAFPRMGQKPKHQMNLKQHKDVAKAFGVEVIEIDDFK